jgi:hypothetical protein
MDKILKYLITQLEDLVFHDSDDFHLLTPQEASRRLLKNVLTATFDDFWCDVLEIEDVDIMSNEILHDMIHRTKAGVTLDSVLDKIIVKMNGNLDEFCEMIWLFYEKQMTTIHKEQLGIETGLFGGSNFTWLMDNEGRPRLVHKIKIVRDRFLKQQSKKQLAPRPIDGLTKLMETARIQSQGFTNDLDQLMNSMLERHTLLCDQFLSTFEVSDDAESLYGGEIKKATHHIKNMALNVHTLRDISLRSIEKLFEEPKEFLNSIDHIVANPNKHPWAEVVFDPEI